MIVASFLIVAGVYLLCGLAFALPFALVGVGKIDPHAARGTWGFRLLIVPGTILLWPVLARRWLIGVPEPPEENNAHRLSAKREVKGAGSSRSIGVKPSGPSTLHSSFIIFHSS